MNVWSYHSVWNSMHMIGATAYVIFIPSAIILNDLAEEKVAWITGASFVFFCFLGYLTGTYVPIFPYFRAWLILWNPFVKEPQFMYKLQKVCVCVDVCVSVCKYAQSVCLRCIFQCMWCL